MVLVFAFINYKTEKNYWLGISAYFLQARFLLNFAIPFFYAKNMPAQVTNFVFGFIFLIMNWTFMLRLLPYYPGIQALVNATAAIFLAQYKLVGNDPVKYWESFGTVLLYFLPLFLPLFFYIAIEKLLLENNVKVVIN